MDLKDLQQKMNKRSGVIIRYDDNGFAYVSVPVGKVPLKQFEEWEARCKSEFGGNRWSAIWTDYLRSLNFDLEVESEALKKAIQEPQIEDNEEDPNPLGLLSN
jgi:hypothetical protein